MVPANPRSAIPAHARPISMDDGTYAQPSTLDNLAQPPEFSNSPVHCHLSPTPSSHLVPLPLAPLRRGGPQSNLKTEGSLARAR
jgi:hypothetical protein